MQVNVGRHLIYAQAAHGKEHTLVSVWDSVWQQAQHGVRRRLGPVVVQASAAVG